MVQLRAMPLYQRFWGRAYGTSASSTSAYFNDCCSSSCPFVYGKAQTDRWSVQLLVGFAAGSSLDIIARLLAEQLNKAQGLTVIVQNLPGAGTLIATEAVARADPNGNTLLITSPPFVINTHLRKLNYDPLTSFEPICDLVHTPTFIVVDNASPYQTLAGLLDAARAQPGAFSLASIGPATTTHIAFEMLKRAANVNMTFVPYPGNVPAVNALLGGHVTSVFADYGAVSELLKARKLRALAVSSPTRMEQLPDVPTFINPATRTSMRTFGSGWSHLQTRRRTHSRNSPAGSLRRCRYRRSRQSSPP